MLGGGNKEKRIFPWGKVIEGEIKYGQLNGTGKTIYPTGVIEKGEFKNGRLNGQGKRTDLLNEIIEQGLFKDGNLV